MKRIAGKGGIVSKPWHIMQLQKQMEFDFLSRYSNNLRNVTLLQCNWLTNAMLKKLILQNPKIQKLDLTDFRISEANMRLIS